MMQLSSFMHQDITHWPITGSDGFGGSTFGVPVLLRGRWEDKIEQYRNSNNEEVVSHTIAYLLSDVEADDYLALGDHTLVADPSTLNASGTTVARTVEQQNRTTDLRNLTALRKVFM